MQFAGLGSPDHRAKIRARLAHGIAFALRGMVGEQQTNGSPGPAQRETRLAPVLLADVKFRLQAVSGFDEIGPVHGPWVHGNVRLESFAGGVERLLERDVLQAGAVNHPFILGLSALLGFVGAVGSGFDDGR